MFYGWNILVAVVQTVSGAFETKRVIIVGVTWFGIQFAKIIEPSGFTVDDGFVK